MKKFLIIGLVFFFSLLVVVVVIQRQQSSQSTKPPGSPSVSFGNLAPPIFPSPVTKTQPTYVQTQALDKTTGNVPAFLVHETSLATLATTLGTRLGFSTTPQQSELSRGTFYDWNETNKTLTVGGSPVELFYISGAKPTTNIRQSKEQLEETAKKFIQQLSLPPIPGLSLQSIQYLAPQGYTPNYVDSATTATLAQLTYGYELDKKPLFVGYAGTATTVVRINANNEVVSGTAYLVSAVAKQNSSIVIISTEEAHTRLTSGQGVVLRLFSDDDKNAVETNEYAVTQSTISKMELSYFYEPKNEVLKPVYVFYGTGTDVTTGKNVHTTTIVSALP